MDNLSSYQDICPVSGIVHRIGQQIRFDLTSLCNRESAMLLIQLRFHGCETEALLKMRGKV